MGFYGNITNTSRTQFQFDKIYPSRAEMDAGTYTDGIYAGRYVLVEYDSDVHQSSFYRAYIDNKTGQMYNAPNVIGVEENKLNVGKNDNSSNNTLPIGTIFFTAENDKENKYINTIYYQVTGGLSNTTLLVEGNYKQITSDKTLLPDGTESTVSNYVKNYAIDNEKYGAGRGYDSTVWQKTYIDNIEKYIMIAELNSVVPTFDVSADAPSVEPITPHFDTQSTDLYYKLHWQPTWGMRIAEGKLPDAEDPGRITSSKDPNHGEYPSDEDVSYSKLRYNSATKEVKEDKQQPEVRYKGAIYYNKAGFEDDKHTYYNGSFKDKISVQPLGVSGTLYNEHGDSVGVSEQPDIQEISIILPSLGNALCDIWDKVYGYNPKKVENNRYRDIEWKDANPKERENGTLIYEKFTGEAVPPKDENYKGNEELGGMTRNSETLAGCINMTHDLMGMIITTDTPNLDEDEYQRHLIYYKDKKYYRMYKYPKYKVPDNIDNATEVYLVDEELENDEWKVRKYNKRAFVPDGKKLAIKDTVDPFGYKLVEIEDFAGNLNTINGLIVSIRNILESDNSETRNKETIQGTINVLNDIIDCFNDLIPGEFLICNNDGKVNSAGWTTNQAIKYDNLGDGSSTEESEGEENQWINLSINADVGKEKITLKHQLAHSRTNTITKSDKNNTQYGEEVTYPNNIDEIGKKLFTGINNDDNINTLKLYTPIVDNAGHVVGKNTETVTLPFGYKYLSVDRTNKDVTEDIYGENFNNEMYKNAEAKNTQDKLTVSIGNKWIEAKVTPYLSNEKNSTITIGHEVHNVDKDAVSGETNLNTLTKEEMEAGQNPNKIKIQDMSFDAAGHITANKAHTYVLPYSFRKITSKSTSEVTTDAASNGNTISADNTQDTLIIAPSNKWIKTSVANKTLSLGHTVDLITITAKTETNLNDKINDTSGNATVIQNTFTVNDITNDAAGHITANQSHTYKLPDGYKIIKTINTPTPNEIKIETLPSDNGQIASNTQDTITIEGANHWIKVGDNNKIIKIYHNSPDTNNKIFTTDANVKNVPEDTSPDSPLFGQQFDIPKLSHDNAGHISGVSKYSIKLPQPSVTPNTAGNVMTGISVNSSTGVFTQDKVNVGTLKISGFSVDQGEVDAENAYTLKVSDSINIAFEKLQNRIKTEEANRASVIDNLDVTKVDIGAGNTIASLAETDGKIVIGEVTPIQIEQSQVTGLDTALNKVAEDVESAIRGGADVDITIQTLLGKIAALEKRISDLEKTNNPTV